MEEETNDKDHKDNDIIEVVADKEIIPSEKDDCDDTLFKPDMEKIRSLFSMKRMKIRPFELLEFNYRKRQWKISKEDNKYELSVLDSNRIPCSKKVVISRLRNFIILRNDSLAIRLDDCQLTIFDYDHDNEKIKGKYYFKVELWFGYFLKKTRFLYFLPIYTYMIKRSCIEKFSGNTLPITDINTVGIYEKSKDHYAVWTEMINNLIEDDKYFEKYGPTLLSMLTKSNDPKSAHYIREIYNKCIKLVKDDPKRNVKLLNIITSSMYDLYKYYPDYLTQFNSEMFLFLDLEKINNNEYYSYSHAFTTFISKVFKLRSISLILFIILFIAGDYNNYYIDYDDYDDYDDDDDDGYTQYEFFRKLHELVSICCPLFGKYKEMHPKWYILYTIGLICFIIWVTILVILFLFFTICMKITVIFTTLLILPFIILYLVYIYFNENQIAKQYINFIVPYVNYSCYPSRYNWWKEIVYPPSSDFVKTCKKEFYTNWNGEAVINFKWKKFGRIYYFIIWLIFIAFLICFTIASYPTNSLSQEIRIKLYRTSIAFGFFHLIFELRQFIWRPKKYLNIWNVFDLSAYLSVIITSIYRIKYDNIPDWALSVSCLFLDLKFLLFFRIFEYFGIYFAIMFGVAKRVFSFLIVLAIIIASFAHAFFLLLHPQGFINSLNVQNSSDPNNPWTLSNTYVQVDRNGNPLDQTFIQVPSENTNLFYSYPTSLLAIYLFLTGNQNSLSPWAPKLATENTILFLLMIVFSFLIVIYLMNLFIGLLNMAIEENNDRASYLAQKAEVIAEIELFYLLPFQRRWKSWFPEVIKYTAGVDDTRRYINKASKKGDWNKDDWPEMKSKILKLLSMEGAIKEENTEEDLKKDDWPEIKSKILKLLGMEDAIKEEDKENWKKDNCLEIKSKILKLFDVGNTFKKGD